MFWIKKLIILLISPLGVLLLMMAAGFLLRWRQIGGPWGRRLVVASALGLFLVTIGPTGQLLLAPLENSHPPLADVTEAAGATHVVVLGGGYTPREKGPVTSELAPASTIRLAEGIRLHRLLGDTTLVVCGASVGQPGSTAEALYELATDLGIPESELMLADSARDTAEEAAAVKALVDPGDTVIVVTSASHMSRAMRLFDRTGVDAIAAPTNHLAAAAPFRPANLWPSARNVRRVERATYEYTGLIWISLGGS